MRRIARKINFESRSISIPLDNRNILPLPITAYARYLSPRQDALEDGMDFETLRMVQDEGVLVAEIAAPPMELGNALVTVVATK